MLNLEMLDGLRDDSPVVVQVSDLERLGMKPSPEDQKMIFSTDGQTKPTAAAHARVLVKDLREALSRPQQTPNAMPAAIHLALLGNEPDSSEQPGQE